jgi:hypothetical protein
MASEPADAQELAMRYVVELYSGKDARMRMVITEAINRAMVNRFGVAETNRLQAQAEDIYNAMSGGS